MKKYFNVLTIATVFLLFVGLLSIWLLVDFAVAQSTEGESEAVPKRTIPTPVRPEVVSGAHSHDGYSADIHAHDTLTSLGHIHTDTTVFPLTVTGHSTTADAYDYEIPEGTYDITLTCIGPNRCGEQLEFQIRSANKFQSGMASFSQAPVAPANSVTMRVDFHDGHQGSHWTNDDDDLHSSSPNNHDVPSGEFGIFSYIMDADATWSLTFTRVTDG